jgi:NDP-sugar pyrophosphorylase family protein
MSDLLSAFRRELKPKGDDLELLANRSDDRFSQKVRNLKSHDTLEKKNLAIFVDAKHYITEYGSEFVVGGKEISESLRSQGFSEPQRRQRIASDRAVIQRSALLRRAAFKHFADTDGSIACMGCGVRAEEVYGEKREA